MVNVLIYGIAGRMGQSIFQRIQKEKDITCIGGIDPNPLCLKFPVPVDKEIEKIIEKAELVIDFSMPEGTLNALNACKKFTKPFLSGTTGLTHQQFKQFTAASEAIPIFYASNMSIGIALMTKLAIQAAQSLESTYDIEIIEKHHRGKKDAPSGTALSLGKAIAESKKIEFEKVSHFGRKEPRNQKEITFHSIRGGGIIGEHSVLFLNDNEILEITHKALSRDLFVDGVIRAARFIMNQPPGLYSVQNTIA